MDQTSGQSAEQTADLLELLEADHRRISELVVGPALVSEVSTHLVAESQLLYPTLRRHLPDADATVDELLETDHRLEELLADVERGEADEPAGVELGRLWEDHVRRQEELFSELRRVAEGEELRRLGDALGPTVMKAPTHPHPHLPREGPLEFISDAVASGVDHVRDALKRGDNQ